MIYSISLPPQQLKLFSAYMHAAALFVSAIEQYYLSIVAHWQ